LKQESFFRPGYSPPTSFYYEVKFEGKRDMDSSFQEVSGLKLTFGVEQIREGGDNSFIHELPTQPTYSNLVLKRCLVLNSALDKWCKDAFEKFEFDPKNVRVSLLGANGGSLASWNVEGAYPISWELTPLNSTSNELAIETLELKYRHFKRER
jgi:phage tail-like protein